MATTELYGAVSLLEQCILYSSPSHNPFSKLNSITEQNDLQSAISEKAKDSQPLTENVALKPNDNLSTQAVPDLLSVNLDFDTPLPEGQSITTPTTPLAKSTNRRRSQPVKEGRSIRRGSRYHQEAQEASENFPNLRPRQKSKSQSPANVSQLEQNNVPTSSLRREFLSFPGEVRDLIYFHLFAGATICVDQNPRCRHTFDLHLAIRSTCTKVNSETFAPLFKQLTFQLNIHSAKLYQINHLASQIPVSIRQSVETLEVRLTPDVISELYPSPFFSLPSLRRLRVVDIISESVAIVNHLGFVEAIDKISCMSREDMKKPDLNPQLWFKKAIIHNRPKILVDYEVEFWWRADEPRAEYMGSLRRDSNRIMSLTYLEVDNYVEKRNELSISEWRSRCKMYAWIEKNCRFVSRRSVGFDALQRLELMQHHHELDKIEFGIAKAMKATQTVVVPERPEKISVAATSEESEKV